MEFLIEISETREHKHKCKLDIQTRIGLYIADAIGRYGSCIKKKHSTVKISIEGYT